VNNQWFSTVIALTIKAYFLVPQSLAQKNPLLLKGKDLPNT
jgi:hypothetical protein